VPETDRQSPGEQRDEQDWDPEDERQEHHERQGVEQQLLDG